MSDIRPTVEQVQDILAEVWQLVEQKDAAYGKSWKRRGWRGNLVRIFSKSDRLENMLWRRNFVGAFSAEDVTETALDQIALLAMFVINYRDGNEWGNGA